MCYIRVISQILPLEHYFYVFSMFLICKAQADERAAKLKEQLEKQRREMFEREQKQWQDHVSNVPPPSPVKECPGQIVR